MIKVLSRIEKTKKELNSLQQFVLEWTGFRTLEYDPKTNEHSIHGERKVDVAKVIGDLIVDLKFFTSGIEQLKIDKPSASIVNAEAALGMIQAFKQKSGPPEWVKNFAQVKTVSWAEYPKEMQKKIEAFDLRGMLVDRMVDVQGKYAIADAMVAHVSVML